MPRPGTPVVHPRMLAGLAPIAEAAQTSTCQVLRSEGDTGRGAFDPATGTYPAATTTLVWAGSCRIQDRVRADVPTVDAAGDPTAITQYQVTVPRAAPVLLIDDLVRVTASPDPQLAGRTLRIADVLHGDFEIERHLVCQDDSGRTRREG